MLAIFPAEFDADKQREFYGWLEIKGDGDTSQASRRDVHSILKKVDELGGVIIMPHPWAPKIGLLDSARKMSTKLEWLESSHIRLTQVSDTHIDKVKYVAHDDEGNFINRYVLSSANDKQLKESTYSLAPFNRTDAHKPEELGDGCSWFRMSEPTISGLKQVACEPRTRIAREKPHNAPPDCIVAICVSGGFCDGQVFKLNDALNCIVGPNHAGKSAIFDFARFGLGQERNADEESRQRLFRRLESILGVDGAVDVVVRHDGDLVVFRRSLDDLNNATPPQAYRFDPTTGSLEPLSDVVFPIELYEQNRINKLREDVGRQLDMLDDFAQLHEIKQERWKLVAQLKQNATTLKPLHDERSTLLADTAGLKQLKHDLAEWENYLPAEATTQRWSATTSVARSIRDSTDALLVLENRLQPTSGSDDAEHDLVEVLFGTRSPAISEGEIDNRELLERWAGYLSDAVSSIGSARQMISNALASLRTQHETISKQWSKTEKQHNDDLRLKMQEAGVESPSEVLEKVEALRILIQDIESKKKPRLEEVKGRVDKLETHRKKMVAKLRRLHASITEQRERKAAELSESLEGQIKFDLAVGGGLAEYRRVLTKLCGQITHQSRVIRNRDDQVEIIVQSINPLDLADALANRGETITADETRQPIADVCNGVTNNTVDVLSDIAKDISLLNQLETIVVDDLPKISVRRRGEEVFADLTTGLSQGEQSAAILLLALQTRTMPLVLDQPEDELGYAYIVHLVVPKILDAKSARQIIVVTHNANIAVLGDADYVHRMENVPVARGLRRCHATVSGCFESEAVTNALLALEGGREAFRYRWHRYGLPRLVV